MSWASVHRTGALAVCLALISGASIVRADASGIVSDDFNACALNTALWAVVDPRGGSSVGVQGVGTSDARLVISIPAGVSHDAWTDGDNAVRVMQPAGNTDFEIQVKLDSQFTSGYQMNGLLVEQDATHSLRYDLNYDGSQAFLFSATFTGSQVDVRGQQNVASANPFWLELTRTGNQWTLRYSLDGQTWSSHATFSFPLAVARVGAWAGNYSTTTAPAFTARIDYFLNTASPFATEDGVPPGLTGYALTRIVTGVTGSGFGGPAGSYESVNVDYNHDGHVDLNDLALFEACVTGPAVPQNDPACADKKLDGDEDVDQDDFGIFQRHLGETLPGSITSDPDQEAYYCNETITVTAVPAPGWQFASWSGDVTGSSNPVQLTMTANRNVTATFVQDSSPVQVVGESLSAQTAKDGQLLHVGYRLSTSDPLPATLQGSAVASDGNVLQDPYRDTAVQLAAGSQWYYRDFLVNLPPAPVMGACNFTWAVDCGAAGVKDATAPGYLTTQRPVSVRVPILTYHYVGAVAYNEYWLTASMFRAQMAALKAYGYTSITLQDLADYRAGISTPPPKPVLITVDDGTESDLTEVYPVLADPNIDFKATAFIITGKVGGTFTDTGHVFNYLTWDQIQSLDASGRMDVQSHTVTHPYLTTLSAADLAAELVNSKHELETRLNKEVRFICYPYGDYNAAVQQAAWQAHYFAGLQALGGVESNSVNKWALRRITVDWNTSVDYAPSHPSYFFMTKIGDPDVVVPGITINSLSCLDPATDQPFQGGQVVRGGQVKVRVQATNAGPSTPVVASLTIDNDADLTNGVVYDSHEAAPDQDIANTWTVGQQTFDWIWEVSADAPVGQHYVRVVIHDTFYVLGYYVSEWVAAFSVQ